VEEQKHRMIAETLKVQTQNYAGKPRTKITCQWSITGYQIVRPCELGKTALRVTKRTKPSIQYM